jgi:hypothetical protein
MGKQENELTVNDTWGTPKYVLDAIVRVLGPIGLDPCSHPDAVVPCTHAIMLPGYERASPYAGQTWRGDGLTTEWDGYGLVYVNPPYSELDPWCQKAAREGDEVVMLVPCRTGNVYWPSGAGQADVEVRLPRVTHRGSKAHAPWHSWLLYYGKRVELALSLVELGEVRVHPRHLDLSPDPAKRWRAT